VKIPPEIFAQIAALEQSNDASAGLR